MRSPLKDKPLRNPGQSLDHKITDLGFDALMYMTVAILFVVLALTQWVQLLTQSKPTPMLYSAIALVAIIVAGLKIRSKLAEVKRYQLGRDGEKAVGQYLELLREKGAKVHHDLCADNFNIDHIVIANQGVFVIETKTWSKPESGRADLVFDGETIVKGNKPVEPNPVDQAKANARFVQEILEQSTGRRFAIQPIVTFPGWYVTCDHQLKSLKPWVLNPKQIPGFINQSASILSTEEVNLINYHLSRYIRTTG